MVEPLDLRQGIGDSVVSKAGGGGGDKKRIERVNNINIRFRLGNNILSLKTL